MTSKKIVLVGAGGMLGQQVLFQLIGAGFLVHALTSSDIDISQEASVRQVLHGIDFFDTVINCAAFTHVDSCETFWDKAVSVNATGPLYLAKICQERGAQLMHFSTDYVFDGQGHLPYVETCNPAPINAYGRSKLLGEQVIQAHCETHYILRIQWLYGQGGRHFIEAILQKAAKDPSSLQVVADQWGSPTSTRTIAEAVVALCQHALAYGIYHVATQGYTSWHGLAEYVLGHSVPSLLSSELPRPAPRPLNGRLDIKKWLQTGLYSPPTWQRDVDRFRV